MYDDFCELPPVEISEEEDRIFTAAEHLLDYLSIYGAKVSLEGMICHLTHLGVTEAQMPALLDTAQRKHLIIGQTAQEPPDNIRLQIMGKLMLERLDTYGFPLHDRERSVLEFLFGIRDGIPRTAAETAAEFGIPTARVHQIEQRNFRRLSRAAGQARRRRRIREFYT